MFCAPVYLKNITAEFPTSKLVTAKPVGERSKLKMKTQQEYGIWNLQPEKSHKGVYIWRFIELRYSFCKYLEHNK